MTTINILTSNIRSSGNELAFLFPIVANRNRLQKEYSLNVQIVKAPSQKIWDCDILIISSWYVGRELKLWVKGKERVVEFLESAKTKVPKIVWADISDSTGTTHFMVLPYVDLYLKGQVLKNLEEYKNVHYGNRIYCDYYHRKNKIHDHDPGELHLSYPLSQKESGKICVSWNTGLANYGYLARYYGMLCYYYPQLHLPWFWPIKWSSPSLKRETKVSCRMGLNYSRATVSYQRKGIQKLIKDKMPTNKIRRREYFKEMQQSHICISPFGLGEISLRDFEITVSGAAIFKPNCDHMETWPNFLVAGETYIDCKWDLSDFEEKLQWTIFHSKEVFEISNNCQNLFKRLLNTEEGYHTFCERFNKLIIFN